MIARFWLALSMAIVRAALKTMILCRGAAKQPPVFAGPQGASAVVNQAAFAKGPPADGIINMTVNV